MLITCPDCLQKISDVAPACLHCGRPLASTPQPTTASAVAPTESHEFVPEAARTEITIGDVILNSTVFVTSLLGIASCVVLVSFRWMQIGWEEYTTSTMLQNLFMAREVHKDTPWYLSIGLGCVFLLPTAACLLPGVFYYVSSRTELLARTVDGWTARLAGIGLGALFFFLMWLWFASMAAHRAMSVGATFWLLAGVCVALIAYSNARLARLVPPRELAPPSPLLDSASTERVLGQGDQQATAGYIEPSEPRFGEVSWKVLIGVGLAAATIPSWAYIMAGVAALANAWAWSDFVSAGEAGKLGGLAKWIRGRPSRVLSLLIVLLAMFLAAGQPSRAQLVAPVLLFASLLIMVQPEATGVAAEPSPTRPASVVIPVGVQAFLVGSFVLMCIVKACDLVF